MSHKLTIEMSKLYGDFCNYISPNVINYYHHYCYMYMYFDCLIYYITIICIIDNIHHSSLTILYC